MNNSNSDSSNDINIDALRRKWQTFAVARDLHESTPDMLQQTTDAERSSRDILLSSSTNSAERLYADQLNSAARSISNVSFQNLESNISSNGGSSSSSNSISRSNDNNFVSFVNTKLANLVICRICQGQGQVKKLYNHMVMDRICETCDGDGLVDISINKSNAVLSENGGMNGRNYGTESSSESSNTLISSSSSSSSSSSVLAKAVSTLHEAIKISDDHIERLQEQGYIPSVNAATDDDDEVPPLE